MENGIILIDVFRSKDEKNTCPQPPLSLIYTGEKDFAVVHVFALAFRAILTYELIYTTLLKRKCHQSFIQSMGWFLVKCQAVLYFT